MMLKLHKAMDLGEESVEPLVVEIVENVPTFELGHDEPEKGRERAKFFYKEEAFLLAGALGATLPGGTMDALLVALLERKVSVLRAPETVEAVDTEGPAVVLAALQHLVLQARDALKFAEVDPFDPYVEKLAAAMKAYDAIGKPPPPPKPLAVQAAPVRSAPSDPSDVNVSTIPPERPAVKKEYVIGPPGAQASKTP